MFHQFLRLLRDNEVQSQLDLAQKLNVSPGLVVQIARDLTRRGYLLEGSGACGEDEPACGGCSAAHTCQIVSTVWTLTEKGIKAIQI